MKKQIIVAVFGIVFFAFASSSFAGTICFKDNLSIGNYYVLSGGKINVKPFSGKFISPEGGCEEPGNAAIFSNGSNYQVTWNSANAPSCISMIESLTLDPSLLSATGNFDSGQNGTIDGSVTWTQVDCSIVPTFESGKQPEDSE